MTMKKIIHNGKWLLYGKHLTVITFSSERQNNYIPYTSAIESKESKAHHAGTF